MLSQGCLHLFVRLRHVPGQSLRPLCAFSLLWLLLLLQAAPEDTGESMKVSEEFLDGVTLSGLVPLVNFGEAFDKLGLACKRPSKRQVGGIDLSGLCHIQPGSVPESLFKQRQQCALQNEMRDLVCGSPVGGAKEAAADVQQSLDLLVALLGVLEVGCDVEGLTWLAGVADSLALLLLRVLHWLRFLGLLGVRSYDVLFGWFCLLNLLFEDSWFLAADRR